ncbi:hypothetical protein [Heyndrickxia coagulans]|uniref:Uncharacterized protein n=1 Tax=Heyndrickxia coagulans TaxID=1398 RepID=A0A150JVH2_HEYCO|nr:hypothetical protein [Heyndrickxia coagulans]KYC60754.1 hypothetical protein B4098_2998 [Heyndrickxia coagulans]
MHLIGIFAGPGEAAEAVLQHHRENVRITVIANNDAAIREVGREAGKGVNGICLHTDVNLMDELKALVKRETYPEKILEKILELGIPLEIATRYVGARQTEKSSYWQTNNLSLRTKKIKPCQMQALIFFVIRENEKFLFFYIFSLV